MISVEEALSRLLAPLKKLPLEQISIADAIGRVLAEDLAARRVALSEGLELTLYTDDGNAGDGLRLDGKVTYNKDEGCWVAVVDWAAVRPTPKSPQPTSAGQR